MAYDTGASGQVLRGDQPAGSAHISETAWGQIISQGAGARRRAEIGEVTAAFACLMFGTFAYAPWLLPVAADGLFGAMALPAKIGATVLFSGFAFLNYRISRRGLGVELHVDSDQEMLRLVRRNRAGSLSYSAKIPFSAVESIYLKRSKSPRSTAHLQLRLAGPGMRPIQVLSAPARELEPILHQMIARMRQSRGPGAVSLRSSLRSGGGAVSPRRPVQTGVARHRPEGGGQRDTALVFAHRAGAVSSAPAR